ncbi:MAG TPA: 4-alpha-glucanotransferase [Rectinemataceae bacterium]|nr:4-alpha-glucanotransferase [Rectinemataceae bacterium]
MRFSHGGRFLSGLALPLSALRTEQSPGCGEYPDLRSIGALATSWNFDLIQLLPVNDSGTQTSPYSALSAFALHPLYLRIADLPELALASHDPVARGSLPSSLVAGFRAKAEALRDRHRGAGRVPHEALLSDKLELLERIWDALEKERKPASRKAVPASKKPSAAAATGAAGVGAAGVAATSTLESLDAELESWIGARPWVRAYAAFVELKRRNEGRPWWEWSLYRDPTAEDIADLWADAEFSSSLRFWAWLQLRASRQLAAAGEELARMGVALMGDIPILMNADSAEVWARRSVFRLGLIAGAPPDMYSYLGQNWGFPIYDWEAIAAEGYSFWKERLIEADAYYSCYRIDHVLGFFRIWSLSDRERSGYLGRFVPDHYISRDELARSGFTSERLRWLSQPHIRESALHAAAGEAAARAAVHAALDRIGNEPLFLFRPGIRGERDIEALPGLSPAAREFLLVAWRDRALFEFEDGSFVATWRFKEASCWPTLSDGERASLESLIGAKARSSEELWAQTGRRLLGTLKDSASMLPCAEDLGAVPDCVPKVLGELGILGLRVLRWTRLWDQPGQPYVSPAHYPELSVACPSVHDSSSLRDWWESEAERDRVWSLAAEVLRRDIGPCPASLDADQVATMLEMLSRSASRFVVFPIQDVIAAGGTRPADPHTERINVPGTTNEGNWGYRMSRSVEELTADAELARRMRALAASRPSSAGAKDAGRQR